MAAGTVNRPPTWFWVVGVIALVWNLMGVMAYFMHVTLSDEALAAMPEAERMLYETQPAWATAAFAVAVWAGALGCVLLLMRKSLAVPVLVASLCGILVQNFHSFFLSKSWEVFGPGGAAMVVMVIVVAVLLIWLARKSRTEGWSS